MGKPTEYNYEGYMIRPGAPQFEHNGQIINLKTVSKTRLKKLAEDPNCYQVQFKKPAEERKTAVQQAKSLVELRRLLLVETAKSVLEAGEKRRAELEEQSNP